MSFKYTNWVYENASRYGWPTGLQIVLHCLADMMNESGQCYPSLAYVASRVALSEKQVRRHIKSLRQQGVITVIKNARGGKPGQTPIYQALFTPSERSKNTTPPTDGGRRPPFSVPLDPPLCPIGLPSAAVDPSHAREPNHHRTTIEPSKNQTISFTGKGGSRELSPWEQTLLKAKRLGLKQDHARLESQGEFAKRVLSA
jgi:hypothetical protein